MTSPSTNSMEHASNATVHGVGRADHPGPLEVSGLLDQVCGNALRLLAETPRPPRNLRVRAGEVSVDIEWPEQPSVGAVSAAGSEPAPAAPAPVHTADPEVSDGYYLTAQTVGVFYRAPEPGAAPFVSEGDTVTAGQQVGIIEAMKLMIPVEADRAGRIAAVLKDNGEPVEYGDRLFALTAADPA